MSNDTKTAREVRDVARDRYKTLTKEFMLELAKRPCSSLDYLYGQAIQAIVARQIADCRYDAQVDVDRASIWKHENAR